MTATDEVFKMFDDVLTGKISVWDFSFNFGEWLTSESGDRLIDENEELFDFFNEEVLEEMELLSDYNLETNKSKLLKYYRQAKRIVTEKESHLLPK
ncbi:TPA: hypothetical protein ACT2IF_000890 [Streptococcus suis]|uniref:hypothetical protein n=1 Tax=Streptococcus suis TaxID=1307 RepID=UPI000CF5BACC|nr:hypothetical protein [Streptococcus suis]NQI84030.1 hypothetical protein [Streptococcus suis]NQK18094.1 hypothetical protein [Streptococcus suis]HEL1616943.1 hypothetical protein [Streptococcus suis]HEL2309193.1 hypothetical protein [Streptococcus suis]HEL2361033.1 hypothetical protein [Streptococcus suis]